MTLLRTFQHLPGIGIKRERNLWDAGCHSWRDLLALQQPRGLPPKLWKTARVLLGNHMAVLDREDADTLVEIVPKSLHWRMIPEFWGKIAFLDIETTGFLPVSRRTYITTIAVFDGTKVHDFVRGENLKSFPEFIARFPAVCTFFGTGFDGPFIQAEMGIELPPIHFDTCFLLHRLGFRGGLKRVEKVLGLQRPGVVDIDGAVAVKLWRLFERTEDPRYLDTLLAYNNEDVLNLPQLLRHAYNGLIEKYQCPFAPIDETEVKAENPRSPDPSAVSEALSHTSRLVFNQRRFASY